MMIPFQTIDWTFIQKEIYKGETGEAIWQTIQFNGIRIRLVQYSKNYVADHYCKKGHIVHCIEGTFKSELESGEIFILTEGMTYIVSDNASSHKSFASQAVKLLIIDGDFLASDK